MITNTKNPIDDIRRFFGQRSMLSNLILINIGIWLMVKITNVFFFLNLQPGGVSANEWFLHFLEYLPTFLHW